MPINKIQNSGKWEALGNTDLQATQKGEDGDDKELIQMLTKLNWHQRPMGSNSDGLLQPRRFF